MKQFVRCFVLVCCALFAVGVLPGMAEEYTVGGRFYQRQNDNKCRKLSVQSKSAYADYDVMGELSFAFYGGEQDKENLCLINLFSKQARGIQDVLPVLADQQGNVLETLVQFQGTDNASFDSCWCYEVYFDDYNGDKMADILFMINCLDQKINDGVQDNVVYLSSVSEGMIWRRQNPEMNRLISRYKTYSQAAKALRAAYGVKSGPKPPLSPPPPPPTTPPPSSKHADDTYTCAYATDKGPLRMTINYTKNMVTGTYANGGTLTGLLNGEISQGTWTQNGQAGNFAFRHSKWGFEGRWNLSSDSDWRGEWNGQMGQCE